MSDIPSDLLYTETHEWLAENSDGSVTVGISDHAQEMLGDLVFVELPETGSHVDSHEDCGVVESVKAASDVYSPLPGAIESVNEELEDSPELVNDDPYGRGWLFRLKPDEDLPTDELMDASAYAAFVAEEE